MATSSNTSKKLTHKEAMVVPSNYHLDPSTRKYSAVIVLGGETHWGDEWQDNLAEAESDLRCMINNLDYAATKTMQCEGFYPERAIIIEEKYQQSGRTNGLFTGLMTKDGEISNDNPQ
jgi:hypothetical protein